MTRLPFIGSRARSRERDIASLARRVIANARPYHPLGRHAPAGMARPDEAFVRRWQMVLAVLEDYDARSFCDLGCAEGYYVRRAAELGLFAIGVDSDPKRLRTANALAVLDDEWSSGFVRKAITSESVRDLPVFDAIACMSLLHHVIHREGIDEARALLTEINRKVAKCMVFDMGGPEETENAWASSLEMLQGDVDANIVAFLEEAGFTNIRMLGHTVGYNTKVQRGFFVAEPRS